MEEIKKIILEKRPKLSQQSVNTYGSIIKNLYKKLFNPDIDEDDDFDLSKLDNTNKIIGLLHSLESNKRKTILSALVILTDKKEYRDLMLDDIRKYNEEQAKQEMSEAQKEASISKSDVDEIYNHLKKESSLIFKKSKPSNDDLQTVQNYIILCLLGGMFIPPRRSQDYVDFKIKNIGENDNYIHKGKLIFNSYKTAKTYGTQTITLPKPLQTILNKWIKINPTEYLLFDSKLNKLSNVKLNQRINKLFGKKVGVNGMRHLFLSDKYQDLIEKNKSLDSDMQQMGSSRNQEKIYIKTFPSGISPKETFPSEKPPKGKQTPKDIDL